MQEKFNAMYMFHKGSFHSVSEDTYSWIRSQPHVKEESITDRVIYNLNENNPFVTCITFSRREEAKNGSDWEWWIVFENHSYRFRVQAKKLKRKGDNTPSFLYSNQDDYQIDLLMKKATEVRAFPLYALYTDYDDIIESEIHPFYSFKPTIPNACRNCNNGIYIISADLIKEKAVNRDQLNILTKDLVHWSYPISLLDFAYSKEINSFATNYPDFFSPLTGISPHNEKELRDIFEKEIILSSLEEYKYDTEQYPEYLKGLIDLQRSKIKRFGSSNYNDSKELFIPELFFNPDAYWDKVRRMEEICGVGVIDATDSNVLCERNNMDNA